MRACRPIHAKARGRWRDASARAVAAGLAGAVLLAVTRAGAGHEVTAGATGRVVPDRFLGFDYKVYRTNYVHDAAWREAVQDLRPALLRYPGGNHANFWEDAEGRPGDGLVRQRPPGTYFASHTLEDHELLLKITGAEPVWSLNILTATIEQQIAWLDRIRARGLPVRRLELGNELFFNDAVSREVFQNGRVYGRVAEEWIASLKRAFPDARCGIPLWAPLQERRSPRLTRWNAQVLEKVRGADAAILHVYVNSGLSDAASLADTGRVAAALGRPRLAMERLRTSRDLPPDLPWWITEFNLIDPDQPTMRGGLPGLFVAHLLFEFLDEPRVEIALLYQLTESSGLAALHGRALEYRGFAGQPAESYSRTAAGEVMRLAAAALEGRPRVSAVQVARPPVAQVDVDGETVRYVSLRGCVFHGASNDVQALLVNLSADPVELDLNIPGLSDARAEVLHLPPDRPLLRRGDARVTAVSAATRLTLPGYALARVHGGAP